MISEKTTWNLPYNVPNKTEITSESNKKNAYTNSVNIQKTSIHMPGGKEQSISDFPWRNLPVSLFPIVNWWEWAGGMRWCRNNRSKLNSRSFLYILFTLLCKVESILFCEVITSLMAVVRRLRYTSWSCVSATQLTYMKFLYHKTLTSFYVD